MTCTVCGKRTDGQPIITMHARRAILFFPVQLPENFLSGERRIGDPHGLLGKALGRKK